MAEPDGAGSDLDRWLEPFLKVLGHKKRRTWAPTYLRGLLGPSERKSLQPMAVRTSPPMSWTRGVRSTLDCAHGPIGPGARLLEFPEGTPHAGSSMEEGAMQVFYSRCAGLDVHKDTVVASARLASGSMAVPRVSAHPRCWSGLVGRHRRSA